MMADGGLALAELGAEGADMPLPLGEDQDDLEPRRVADMLEQDRRASRLVIPLLGPAEGPGLGPDRLGRRCMLDAGFRRWHRMDLLSMKKSRSIGLPTQSAPRPAPPGVGITPGDWNLPAGSRPPGPGRLRTGLATQVQAAQPEVAGPPAGRAARPHPTTAPSPDCANVSQRGCLSTS